MNRRVSRRTREWAHFASVCLLPVVVALGITQGWSALLWAPVAWVLQGVLFAAPDWTERNES